jgi:hypothetical protein
MTRPRGMQLADYIHELADHHQHRETYTVRSLTGGFAPRSHVTRVPSLMTQLWENDTPSNTAEEGPRPGFKSKPAARLEALDTAVRIDLEAARWIRDLGEDDVHTDTAASIRQLHSLAVSAHPLQRAAITNDVRRWWTQARIVTGWDSPAWSPDNTCPQCGERGTLKVRLGEHIAMCTKDVCRTTWDETNIGLLADHIRAESEAERQQRPGTGPCWSPWPKPSVPDLSFMCPACGSVRCWHALSARLSADARAAAS